MSGTRRPMIAATKPAFWRAGSDIGRDGVLVLVLPLEQLVGGSGTLTGELLRLGIEGQLGMSDPGRNVAQVHQCRAGVEKFNV